MHITTLITTYNRADLCMQLLRSYAREAKASKYEHNLILIDDCSSPSYVPRIRKTLETLAPSVDVTILRCAGNHGRINYWMLLNELYAELAQSEDTDYIVQLPDDVTLAHRFFAKAVARIEAIYSYAGAKAAEKFGCLNLYRCHRDSQWGSGTPKPFIFGRYELRLAGWVDMCYIAHPRMMEALEYRLNPIDRNWRINPQLGSGTGTQISRRLRSKRLTMWQVEHSLVIDPGTQVSQMNPQRTQQLRTA